MGAAVLSGERQGVAAEDSGSHSPNWSSLTCRQRSSKFVQVCFRARFAVTYVTVIVNDSTKFTWWQTSSRFGLISIYLNRQERQERKGESARDLESENLKSRIRDPGGRPGLLHEASSVDSWRSLRPWRFPFWGLRRVRLLATLRLPA